ncbi:MAG: amidohydrolase family protein [Janthinobacterium lividum]
MPDPPGIIDAHQHAWDPALPWHEWPDASLPAINLAFLPEKLAPELTAAGVAGVVLVQSQPNDADTDWLLELAGRAPAVRGVVGWIDVKAPGADARIAALVRHPKLCGVRPMLQDLPADWILDPLAEDALRSMVAHDLAVDALIRPAHLRAIATLADRHPELRIIIDHAAKPDVAADVSPVWADDMARLAERPNLFCKVSGLVTQAGPTWSRDQLRPIVDRLLGLFGRDRLLWGSDWPVLLLATSYGAWLAAAQALVPHEAHAAVFGGTATRVYRLT